MQSSNPNSFPFPSGADLASQNVLMQGLGMNPQGLAPNPQGAMGGFMQNQPIGYPMFDQGMQNNYPQANMGMNQFNPMFMQQRFGMQPNAMNFQMQQQLMNAGNPSMMSAMGDQMNPYGGINPLMSQNPYNSGDAMMALQGMMGGNKGNQFNGDNYNSHGGGNNQRYNNNSSQNNDTSLRLNTVYITDLPQNADHDMIRENFTKVGPIKVNSKSGMPMIWIFKDRGVPKGDALVTFESNSSASNAISFFKENDFEGRTIEVRIATNSERPMIAPSNDDNGGNRGDGFNSWAKNDWSNNRQRGDFRNNNRGNTDKSRGPDWICAKCNNNNFSWRESCNRCQEPKGDDAIEVQKQDRGFNGGPRSNNNNRMVQRNSSSRSQDGGPMRGPKRTPRTGPY